MMKIDYCYYRGYLLAMLRATYYIQQSIYQLHMLYLCCELTIKYNEDS